MDVASIDEEILRQKSTIRNLYSRRKTLALISRLPTEVLEFIFIRLARNHFYDNSRPRAPDWFHISHVSSRWRNAALSCPTLWSHVFPTSQRWLDVLLERSGRAQLEVRIDLKNLPKDLRKLSTFTEKIREHAERIKGIHFYTVGWDKVISKCFETLYSRTSHLRVLDFSVRPLCLCFEASSKSILSPCYFPKLGDVMTLSLEIDCYTFLRQDVLGFQAVLRCMPNLVNLCLDRALAGAGDFISSTEFDTLQRIDLPLLARLSVVAPLSTIIALLSGVNIPVHAQIRLENSLCEEEVLGNHTRHCSVLAQHYNFDRVSSLPILCSVVMGREVKYSDKAYISFSTSSDYDDYQGHLLNGASSVLLDIIPGRLNTSILGKNISAFMPTNNVQTLHISDPPASQAFWKETMAQFPGLRRIKLSDGSLGDDLVSAILPYFADKPVKNQSTKVRTSALEELMLVRMKLKLLEDWANDWKSVPRVLDCETGPGVPPFEGLQSLCSALHSFRLIITSCNYTEDDEEVYYDMAGKWESGRFNVVRERYMYD